MRPQILKFGGIGAYPSHVEVNFDELSKKGLYLVVGPTGSGKTTIFDAMTFALYGKTASNREGMFVSDHDTRVDPYVELSFSHQGRFFVVHREPPKDKDKNAIPSKQWFREIDSTGTQLRTETGAKTVNSEVSDLLGLDADQFMQVILLPQNKFQEFLMAKSSDRKPLLQKIFGTSLYFRIALHLKEAANRLEAESEEMKSKLSEQQAIRNSIVDSLADQSYFDSLEDLELSVLIDALKLNSESLLSENKEVVKKYTAALAAETQAKSEIERFDAGIEQKELDKKQKDSEATVHQARIQLKENEKARRVTDISDEVDNLRVEATASRTSAEKVRSDIAKAVSKLMIEAKVVRNLTAAVPTASAKSLSSELSIVQKKVSETLKAASELEALASDQRDLVKQIDSFEKSLKKNKSALEKLTTKYTKEKTKLKAAAAADKKIPGLSKKVDDIDALHAEADVDTKMALLATASKNLEKAKKSFSDAEQVLDVARKNRTRHLAGELAALLLLDEECPVCGSTSHPKKAKKTTEVQIDVLEKKRDSAQVKKTAAEALVDESQKLLAAARAAEKKLPTASAEEALRKQLAELETLAEGIEDIDDTISDIEQEIDDLKQEITDDGLDLKERNTQIQHTRTRIDVLAPSAEALGSLKLVKDAELILNDMALLIDDLEKIDIKVLKDATKMNDAEKRLQTSLAKEKIASVKIAKASCLDTNDIERLVTSIEEFETRATRIHFLNGQIGSEPLPKTRPSLEALTAAVEIAKEATDESSASLNKTSEAISNLQIVLEKITKLGPQSVEKIERANSALALARVVERGAGSGESQQLGLEEWVQRTLFEEVCIVATSQLQKLSNNRYALTLEADGAITKKRAGGLELYVLDSQSGKARSVHTLSGGEQFLTSLALALALAEVVERHSGGMELSTLFIDEGFGSLDAHTLDAAIDVLLKLHDTGRTVGVITHVDAMQQQLQVGIRINKTNSGSTLELVD